MKIEILSVGKLRNPSLMERIDFYLNRIKPFVEIQTRFVREIPVKKGFPAELAIGKEGDALIDSFSSDSFLVALDERGKQKTTLEWKEFVQKRENQGTKQITFIIGGAYGLSESVLRHAHEKWALSKMTLTHELAQVVLFEQIYRVFTLLRGIPYHH